MTETPDATRPLAGVRIIEISSFVAVPLAGMTLAQLGAEVIRVDPVGGAADYHRWPVTDDGESIYWAGLNKGKRSVAVDVRSSEGQQLIQRLIADSGILITNVAGRQWHSYETLVALRPDLIHVEISGRADGGTGVDYTVNAGLGFPLVTGPAGLDVPVNHVLPAWDVACGIYAALAVTAALRHRDATGDGQRIGIPLENVALATAGNLSFLTEVMVNGTPRERIGNSIFGQYGQQFSSGDGVSFMIVALTGRHFRDLTELTGTAKAVAALGETLGADFTDEGDRYRHRDALTGLFTVWFTGHTGDEVAAALSSTSILWERYRTFADVVTDAKVTDNALFTTLEQPRIGQYLAPDCRCRSTAPTRRRCRRPRSAITPPTCCARISGSATRRSPSCSHRGRWRERAAGSARPARGRRRTRPGWARRADRRASAPSAASSWRRAWPPRAGPSTGQSAHQHASAVPARRRGRRRGRLRRRAGLRRAHGGRPPGRVPPGWPAAHHGQRVVLGRHARARTRSSALHFPATRSALARTGPAGPAPSMPLDELDIRIDDDRSSGDFVRRMWWRVTVRRTGRTRCCTPSSPPTSATCT